MAHRFTPAELTYLFSERRLARLATVGPEGAPHVCPVGWKFGPDEQWIDIGGWDLVRTKKFRDVQRTGRAALVIDDVLPPWRPRGVEIRGRADAIEEPEPVIRLYPERIVGWGLDSAEIGGRNARTASSPGSHRPNRDIAKRNQPAEQRSKGSPAVSTAVNTSVTSTHPRPAHTPAAVGGRRAVAAAVAALAALAVWSLAEVLFGLDVHAPGFGAEPPKDLHASDVILSAGVAGLAGWALLAVLERLTSRPRQLWTRAAVATLVLSLGGPLSSGIEVSSRVVLLSLHAVTAAVLIPLLLKTVEARRQGETRVQPRRP